MGFRKPIMKVCMRPLTRLADSMSPSGITTVLREYNLVANSVGIEFVDEEESADVVAIHAGMAKPTTNKPLVAHCHGLYWTGDLKVSDWEWKANRDVIEMLRSADVITVPSKWVGETIGRDMHISPVVLPHAISPEIWEAKDSEIKYVLWNKNRMGDVCDPTPLYMLADKFRGIHFLTTFMNHEMLPNIRVTGLLPHSEMKEVVQRAHIYLASTKETFGIGTLEAMASGVPILAFRHGGNAELVEHGVNGYLANPYDYEDLYNGLSYCLANRDILGKNSKIMAAKYTWNSVAEKLLQTYESAIEHFNRPHSVSVVIPCFNKSDTLVRAVTSAANSSMKPSEIIIVNNNSTDAFSDVIEEVKGISKAADVPISILNEEKQGVAHARNKGIYFASTRYVCCLDADDEIEPEFLKTCVGELKKDKTLALAYTRMKVIDQDGNTHSPDWPGEYIFDNFLVRKNPVPTCNVFSREVALRLGGYRQRYAPHGAGAEDVDLWFRMGASGYGGKLASEERLFVYHLGGLVSGDRKYSESDWHAWQPWTKDFMHPFASLATPKEKSHAVRAYDEPLISVIIPCAPSHLEFLTDALDSLEAQTFRKWEAIVVFDVMASEAPPSHLDVMATYPYAKFFYSDGKGAGSARNLGVVHARANSVLFLDADDWLEPACLDELYKLKVATGSISYSDYYGHSYIDANEAQKLKSSGRLVSYDEKTSLACAYHKSLDYSCEQAVEQPKLNDGRFYIWNLITSLVPKSWHNSIGGFDEDMESWEDWDYWIRMARTGHCFARISASLVNYRFFTGQRREIGRQKYAHLINYLQEKYSKESPMPCKGCSGGKNWTAPAKLPISQTRNFAPMSSDDTVMVKLVDGNIGDHSISIRGEDNVVRNYGHRKDGDQFLMRQADALKFPNKFVIQAEIAMRPEIVAVQEDTPEPKPLPEPVESTPTVEEPTLVEVSSSTQKAPRTIRKSKTRLA